MFLRVPVKCRSTILDALRAAGFEQEANAAEQFTSDYVDPETNQWRERWVARAQHTPWGCDIQFDDDAPVSHSEGGQYVLGWVWVKAPAES